MVIKELADKIEKANELIKIIDAFKQSVADGTDEEFLANMPWTDKSSLSRDMGLSRMRFSSEKTLTEEDNNTLILFKVLLIRI